MTHAMPASSATRARVERGTRSVSAMNDGTTASGFTIVISVANERRVTFQSGIFGVRWLASAFQSGAKMAFGTDAGVYPHGDNGKQFFYMVKFGMTPAQAIHAATTNAADLIGRSKDVGSIEAGKYADIIAVAADPLQDIRALENVGFVMKGGVVYKNTLTGK